MENVIDNTGETLHEAGGVPADWNEERQTDQAVTNAFMAWLARPNQHCQGVGANEAWNAGVAYGEQCALAALAARPLSGGWVSDAELAEAAYKGYDDYWTEDCKGDDKEAWLASAKAVLDLAAPKAAPAGEWQPIKTAPKGANGIAWMYLAWGPEDDQATGKGMRMGDKFYAAATFHSLGQEKQFELREVEVSPTHWMTLPAPPAGTDEGGR